MKKGWEIKTLGELFEITSSKRVFQNEWKSSGVPFYRAREIVKLAKNGFVDNELFISDEMFDSYSKKYGAPKEGDIMVTGVGTLGICYLVKSNQKFYFKDGNIIWLKSKGVVNSRYVEYGFKSEMLRKQIDDSIGATVGTYTIIKAKSTEIPVPPLPEQQRIVSILDKCFEAIDKAKSNAERNLQNAKELFESYLKEVFEKGGEGWEVKKLLEISNVFEDGDWVESKDQSEEGVRLIQTGNIGNGFFKDRVEKARYISEDTFKRLKCTEIFEGDFLISRLPEPVGRACILPNTGEKMITAVDCTIIRLNEQVIFPKWFLFYSLSHQYQSEVNEQVSGATGQRISRKNLGQINIPLPPLSEQKRIVLKTEELRKQTEHLLIKYQRKIAEMEELKKSILQKAFNGELNTEITL